MTPTLRAWLVPLVAAPALAAPPTLVTLADGPVTRAGEAVPDAPFVLDAGQTLTLGEGATVIVLHDGAATRLRGPRTVDPAALEAPSVAGNPAQSALGQVLTREVSYRRAGASRGGDLSLVRPVPGGTVLGLHDVAWRCEGCGEQTVQVHDFLADKVVWTGSGEGRLGYEGPALTPGPYLVTVGGRDFSITVAPAEDQERLKLARQAADEAMDGLRSRGIDDMASLISIPAGLYMRAGLASDALWAVDEALRTHPDDAGLRALRTRLERQAGIPVP